MSKTIIDLFEQSVSQYPDNTFLLEKTGKAYSPTTYSEVRRLVYRLGAGLQALGIRKGENMALLSEGRNMWIIGELAMFYAGAVNVPLSVSSRRATTSSSGSCMARSDASWSPGHSWPRYA